MGLGCIAVAEGFGSTVSRVRGVQEQLGFRDTVKENAASGDR